MGIPEGRVGLELERKATAAQRGRGLMLRRSREHLQGGDNEIHTYIAIAAFDLLCSTIPRCESTKTRSAKNCPLSPSALRICLS